MSASPSKSPVYRLLGSEQIAFTRQQLEEMVRGRLFSAETKVIRDGEGFAAALGSRPEFRHLWAPDRRGVDDQTLSARDERSTRDRPPADSTRAQFDDRVIAALSAAQRLGQSVAFLLLDVDRFAKFNAQHGRQAGDAALSAIHRRIASSLGEDDLVTSFGGDDFAVLCRNPNGGHGPTIAQILCGRIANGPVEIPGLDGVHFFTASVGVCLGPSARISTPADFLVGAEGALARAKAAGGNRVAITPQEQDG